MVRQWLLFVVVPAVLATLVIAEPSAASDPPPQRPNVLIVVADDQPKGTEDAMPILQNRIAARGLTFTNGIIPTSACCPSRSSLLTGNHSHTTQVYSNLEGGSSGGWSTFAAGPESDTLATRLDDVGYRTGLFGKYLNGFNVNAPDGFVPPGWDTFRAILGDKPADGTYYDYRLTGLKTHFGSTSADYSTDVLGALAVEHIASTPPDTPWFVYYAPYGPHGPTRPAPRDVGTWPLEPESAIDALNERNVSDKPQWVQKRELVNPIIQRRKLTRQHEAVKSIDYWLDRLLDEADLSNTLVIYLSDNGFMLGAHRITGKDVPYARSTEVPMYARWDGVIDSGVSTGRVTPQIDLTAMVADAARLEWSMEGINPLTEGRSGSPLEAIQGSGRGGRHPAYCGWRSKRYLFVEYTNDRGAELYDYRRDPDELRNAIDSPQYRDVVRQHRQLAKQSCSPVPPGFSWR